MLTVLHEVEDQLRNLLLDENGWNSLYVNHHPPIVERLWRQWKTYRVYLHKIYPCGLGEALIHPHPWPSAMRVLSGTYEMAVGYGKGLAIPPVAATIIMGPGSEYEMTDPDAWHYVRPIDCPTISLMVTGIPWSRTSPGSGIQLNPLREEQRKELLAFFRQYYAGA